MNARRALIYNDILVFSYNIETIIATYRTASFEGVVHKWRRALVRDVRRCSLSHASWTVIGRPLTLIYRQYENLFCLKLPKIDFLEVKEDQKSPVRDSTCEQAANKAPNIIRSSRRFEETYFLIFTQIAVPKVTKGSTLFFSRKSTLRRRSLQKVLKASGPHLWK